MLKCFILLVVLYHMLVILHTQVTQPLQSFPFGKYVYHQCGFIIHQLINIHIKKRN